jgi:mono/diheme cytochrome c family protein
VKYALRAIPILAIAGMLVYLVVVMGTIDHPGKPLYKIHCASCHGEQGAGIKKLVPPLSGTAFPLQHLDSIPCWLKHGMNYPVTVNGTEYNQIMYPVKLNAIQTANVVNYIMSEFQHKDTTLSSRWVEEKWAGCR